MFEHFTTLEEIFNYKLGSALSMEHDSLELLVDMEQKAMRSDLKELFQGHAEETRRQIQNLHQCFTLLGEEVHRQPSPTTKGLAKEFKSAIDKTDSTLADGVILAAALESEHYETAVYETLLLLAKATGASGIAELLKNNLEQEEAAITQIKVSAEWIMRADAQASESQTQERTHTAGEPAVKVPPYMPPGGI